jgi:hypothetical protein
MKGFNSRSPRLLIIIISVVVAILLGSFSALELALSRVLDPDTVSPERSILSLVANYLDGYKIDTVYGKSTDYPLPAGGVRVAPLAGFKPNSEKRDWGSYPKESWVAVFQKSAFGFIAAVPNKTPTLSEAKEKCGQDIEKLGADVCDFVQKWLSSPPEQRIFVAFTKDDFDHAAQVGKSFEEAGFAVFLFLKAKDEKPWADPAMVGEVFAQARFRMVIDSANARGSPGVALEHECCGPLLLPPPPSTAVSLALQGKG